MHKVIIIISFALPTLAQNELIENLVIHKNTLTVGINRAFKEKYLTSNFFVEYDQSIDLNDLDYSIITMPFVLNVISIIWIEGNDYYIDSMDEELFESLKTIKNVFSLLYPKVNWNGKLIPRKLVKNVPSKKLNPKTDIALLYSGGLDSTTSSLFLSNKKQLLISVWGSWDIPLFDKNLWASRKTNLLNFAQERSQDITFIKSNFSSFLNRDILDNLAPEIPSWRIMTVEGIGWAGLTAPILYSKGYQTLYIASSDTWEFKYCSAANPYIDNNIHLCGISVKHHLFNFSRFEKIKWLVDYLKKKKVPGILIKGCLDRTQDNCTNCTRCLLTMAGLMLCDEEIRNYGYQISRETAIERMKDLVTNERESMSSSDLFQFGELVKQLRSIPGPPSAPFDLLWLLDQDFDMTKGYGAEKSESYDWKTLDSIYPEIAKQVNEEQYCEGFSMDRSKF